MRQDGHEIPIDMLIVYYFGSAGQCLLITRTPWGSGQVSRWPATVKGDGVAIQLCPTNWW